MAKIQKLGPYLIKDRLGEGGMGTVYRGQHQDTGQVVAVKVLLPGMSRREGFRARFDAEIESLRKLNHPNIVRLYGFGEDQDTLFYSMELVEGQSLDNMLEKGKTFNWQQTINMGKQICGALRHAHDRGIIHRDLKPANLILTPDGVLKLADFGIARLYGVTGLTVDGGIVGTATYMPPEQVEGLKITVRSDLYSLGCVLYAMLAGRPPFKARSLPQMLRMQVSQEPDPVRTHAPSTPVELEVIIKRLLVKEPNDRIANARVLERSLTMAEAAIRLRNNERDNGSLTNEPEATVDETPVDPESQTFASQAPRTNLPAPGSSIDVGVKAPGSSVDVGASPSPRPQPMGAPSAAASASQPDVDDEDQTLERSRIMSAVLDEIEQTDAGEYDMRMSDPGAGATDDDGGNSVAGASDENLRSRGEAVYEAVADDDPEDADVDQTVDNPNHQPAARAGQSSIGQSGPAQTVPAADNTFWPQDDDDLAGPDHLMPEDDRPEPMPTDGQFFTAELADDAPSLAGGPDRHDRRAGATPGPVPAMDDEYKSDTPSISSTMDEARAGQNGTLFVTVEEANRIEAQQKAREIAEYDPGSPMFTRLIAIIVLVVAAGIVTWFFLPRSADQLYEDIVFEASSGSTDRLLSTELDIMDFIRMHPEDERVDELQAYLDEIEVINLERKMRVRSRRMNAGSNQLPVEQAYLQAMQISKADPEQGVAQMEAIIAVFSNPHESEREETMKFVTLAQKQRDELKQQVSQYAAGHMMHARKRLRDAKNLQHSDPAEARAICVGIITLYESKHWARHIIEQARELLDKLPEPVDPPSADADDQTSSTTEAVGEEAK